MCSQYEQEANVVTVRTQWTSTGFQFTVERLGKVSTEGKEKQPVIRLQNERVLVEQMHWGVRNDTTRQMKAAGQTKTDLVTNARGEKLQAAFWRDISSRRRCLVPATAYFELDRKQGFKMRRHHLPSSPQFFLGGVWETWTEPQQDLFAASAESRFAVVTTPANEAAAQIYHRMPLIFRADDTQALDRWLDVDADGVPTDLVGPLPADLLEIDPLQN